VAVAVGGGGAPRAGPGGGGPAASSAFVRVNQVGYPAAGSKRAYLMASADETGATFSVKDSTGATVYRAPVGATVGSWGNTFKSVYGLDFDAVAAAGSYTIAVSGPVPATSPSFRIDTGPSLYAGPLANALSFYHTTRNG